MNKLFTNLLFFLLITVGNFVIAEQCSDIQFGKLAFVFLEPNTSVSLENQFLSDTQSREKNAEAMRGSGYRQSKKLIEKYADQIKPISTILEIGPFENPLGNLIPNAHWLVWEYDAISARKIFANSGGSKSVFQVDLNALDKMGWERFITDNQTQLVKATKNSNLNGLIMSSVMNYFDYQIVLNRILPLLEPGALVVLSNSNSGTLSEVPEFRTTKNFYGEAEIIPSSDIIEFLLANYGNKLEILEKSSISFDRSLEGSTRFSFAIRWNSKQISLADLYTQIVALYIDGKSSPVENTSDGIRNSWGTIFRHLAESTKELTWVAEWDVIKLKKLNDYFSERKILIARVANALEADAMTQVRTDLLSYNSLWQIIPERQILIAALEMPNLNKRKQFLEENLSKLYKKLNFDYSKHDLLAF